MFSCYFLLITSLFNLMIKNCSSMPILSLLNFIYKQIDSLIIKYSFQFKELIIIIYFLGLETMSATKEKFLKRRCKDRLSGYFYKTKNDLLKSQIDPVERKIIEQLINRCLIRYFKFF